MITSGEGKLQVFLEKKYVGSDILYILGGGQKTHIGGVVICEPDKKSQVVKLGSHYDHLVLKPLAEAACKKYDVTVVAVGGIHVDNATKEEIDIVIRNCSLLHDQV